MRFLRPVGLVMAVVLCAGALSAQEEVRLARQDLAARLGVQPAQIAVVQVEPVTWADRSLDCPEVDVLYAPADVPGYRILFSVGGQQYEYHTDRARRIAYCGRNIVPVTQTPPVVERARQDLARRLGCVPAAITIVETPYVEWPTREPVEPEWMRERPFPGDIQAGYRPVLACGDRQYEYRTDLVEQASFVRELPPATPESYSVAYLALAQQPDGSNLWDLAVRNFVTGELNVPVRRVVDFAIAPDGGIIFARRQPEEGMVLYSTADPRRPLHRAANLQGLAWDGGGERWSAWTQAEAGGPWRLVVGEDGKAPTVVALRPAEFAPGVPGPLSWQGDQAAFNVTYVDRAGGYLLRWPEGQLTALPGRFAGWLDTRGQYLMILNDQLIRASLQAAQRGEVVAQLPQMVWASPLFQCRCYVALTQAGDMLRVWTGELVNGGPRLLGELEGQFVKAQLGERGTVLMVQQVAPGADDRQQCRVTLVETVTGQQEPLSGACVGAQLLPLR